MTIHATLIFLAALLTAERPELPVCLSVARSFGHGVSRTEKGARRAAARAVALNAKSACGTLYPRWSGVGLNRCRRVRVRRLWFCRCLRRHYCCRPGEVPARCEGKGASSRSPRRACRLARRKLQRCRRRLRAKCAAVVEQGPANVAQLLKRGRWTCTVTRELRCRTVRNPLDSGPLRR